MAPSCGTWTPGSLSAACCSLPAASPIPRCSRSRSARMERHSLPEASSLFSYGMSPPVWRLVRRFPCMTSTSTIWRSAATARPWPSQRWVGVDGERSSGRVYDVATRQEIGCPVFTGETDLVTIGQGGTILASAARTLDGTTYLFDTATGQQIGDPFTGGEQIAGMMFTPDGTTLATSSFDGTIRLWNVASAAPTPFGTQVTNYEYQSPYVTFMPDGKTLATGSTSARLQFWQVTTHRLVRSMFQPGWASVALSPAAPFAATDTRDGTIRVRSMTTLRLTHEPFTVPGGGRVGITALSVGGKILAVTTTTSSGDSTFRLWDTATGRPIGAPIAFPVSGAGINTMEFSRSGKYFAAGAWTVSPSSSVTLWVQLWDTATWRPVGHPLSMFSPILTSPVRAVAFNTAGTDLAVGGGLGAQVWDIATLKPVGAALLDP